MTVTARVPQHPQLSPLEMQRLSTLATLIARNPKHRATFAGMVQDVAPNTPEANSFSDVNLQRQFAALSKKVDDSLLQNQITKAQEKQAEQRAGLISSGRYTEDQVKLIEAGPMTRLGIGDYEAGAIIYAAENPPENPALTPPTYEDPRSTWEFPSVEGQDGKLIPFKDFAKDPVKASINAAYRQIGQFMRSKTNLPAAFHR